jgi:hypothetical protein
MYLKEWKAGHNRETCIPMFIVTVHSGQAMETTQMEFYSAISKNETTWFAVGGHHVK